MHSPRSLPSLAEMLRARRGPNIIRGGRIRELFVPAMKIGFKGIVTVELIHAATGLVKQRLQFENLITDVGLNALGSALTIEQLVNSYIEVGTGSTAPANADTGLVAPVSPRTNSNGGITEVAGSGSGYAYWYRRIVRVFTEAQVNGNLTEFGLFSASTAGTMWCRQLFKDGLGDPTTITKTSLDQLKITYEIRGYSPTVDTTGTVTLNSVNYDWTSRAANIATSAAWGATAGGGVLKAFGGGNWSNGSLVAYDSHTLGTTSQGIQGSSTSAENDTFSAAAYTTDTFYRDLTGIWSPSIANFGAGIGGYEMRFMSTASARGFQTVFSAFIPKDNTMRLTLVSRVSWGRYV